MILISADGLGVKYGGKPVLHDVNFSISAAEIVTLVGPNGSGKSTLIRALLGIVTPTRGTVSAKQGLRIGYVPQKLSIDGTMPMTVARFLALPRRAPDYELNQVMSRVGIADLAHRQMAALSGGQFQRILLARALLGMPDILILDEPTQGLDQPGVAGFYQMIEELRRDIGCAILLVSHDLHVVMGASDRVICLNGHICCEGSPQVVSAAPEYRELFGMGTKGALALYRHEHDHHHDHDQEGA
ncbi:MAG: metal ABC transporter ATP-binding protein [Paracoccaceae bacterium]